MMVALSPDDGFDGFGPGRDCSTCGQALEPGHIDDTLTLVWFCPTHGAVATTVNPFNDQ